ncbi:unnamed protein product [Coffea canephora]|uniref:Uncharacterized protein n=1 Tax=Coffea canephora TaxID=49390 RepID=A0A068URV4_COFCA|nr:unnamed protein product [Coffea canephora]
MNERASEESADELSPTLEDKGSTRVRRFARPPGRDRSTVPGEPEQPNTSDESSLKVEEANKKGQITEDRRVDRQNPIPENANGEGSGDDITSRSTKMAEAKISHQNLDHDSARSIEEEKVKDKPRGSAVLWCCSCCCCCFRHEEK